MNRIPSALVILNTAFLVSWSSAAVLSVDFGGSTAQSGFNGMNVTGQEGTPGTPAVATQNFGGLTVSVAGGSTVDSLTTATNIINSRSRGIFVNGGGYSQQDLMQDRIVAVGTATNPATGNGTGNGLYLKIEGLSANTDYLIQVWSVDHTGDPATLKTGYSYLFDATNEASGYTSLPELGNFTIAGGTNTISDNDQFSNAGVVTTDGSGALIVKSVSNMDGAGIMSGFSLELVPEPSALLLSQLGLLLAFSRRRS